MDDEQLREWLGFEIRRFELILGKVWLTFESPSVLVFIPKKKS